MILYALSGLVNLNPHPVIYVLLKPIRLKSSTPKAHN